MRGGQGWGERFMDPSEAEVDTTNNHWYKKHFLDKWEDDRDELTTCLMNRPFKTPEMIWFGGGGWRREEEEEEEGGSERYKGGAPATTTQR